MRFGKRGNRHGVEGYMLLLELKKGGKCRKENVFYVRIKLTDEKKIDVHVSRRYIRRGYTGKFPLHIQAWQQSWIFNQINSRELQVAFYILMYVWIDVSTRYIDHVIVVTTPSLHHSSLRSSTSQLTWFLPYCYSFVAFPFISSGEFKYY